MSGLEILKLRENLTISEAYQYLAKSIGTKDGNLSVKYIVNLINDGVLSLYLTPENFLMEITCSAIDDDCIEYIMNSCTLVNKQKITKAYLSITKSNLIVLNKKTTLLGDLFVNGESEIVQKLARLSDTPEHIRKDIEDTNKYAYKFLRRKNSSLSKPLSVSPDHYGLHIKKLQIDEFITTSQPEQKLQEQHQTPKKSSTTSKPERLGRTRQIELIDNKLRELGHEPEKILAGKEGAPGLRGQVKEALANEPEFAKKTAFKGAWQAFLDRNKETMERKKEERLQKICL